MPASRIAAFTACATFSTIAGRPISSGKSSALIAVPIARRNFEAGPVLAFRANAVACGGDDPVAAARPDHRDGGDLRFAALAVPLQRPAKGLVGQDAREVVDATIAFGLADDGDHLVRGELPAREAGLEP